MKVIITGSEGFIGKALAATLIKRGIEVIGVDRLNGREAGEYFSNTDLKGIDCVFHLAAQTSVFNHNKTDIIRDNIELFKIVCDKCASRRVKLVYASSSTANAPNTTSLYGISKQFNEQYARCYNRHAIGVRFHNVYGSDPRQRTLLWHLLNDERVKLYNMGRNVRHFTFIDDIVESLIFAYGCNRPLINAVNPQSVTTAQFAEIVRKYHNVEIELVDECRELDRNEQRVDDSIYTAPLEYTSVENGIRLSVPSIELHE